MSLFGFSWYYEDPTPSWALQVAPDGGYKVAGDEFLIERYKAAKAVPAELRSYDVATFVRTYELLGDVVHTLPWIEVCWSLGLCVRPRVCNLLGQQCGLQ